MSTNANEPVLPQGAGYGVGKHTLVARQRIYFTERYI